MVKLLKKRRAKKQAEELAKKTSLQELRAKNRAKREANLKARREAAKVKKAMSPGMSGLASAEESAKKSAEMKKFREQQKKDQATTERAMANKKSRASVGFGEVYERIMADGTTKKMIKRKQKEDNKAKHGGALAIMIAPVKTKKMKAVKKGAHGAKVKKAPGGAAMGKMKMKMMKKGGKLKMVKGPDGKMVPFYAADGKGKMMYGGSMKKKMAMGGRMGSKEMMESMKKDDKMLKNGGKITKKQKAKMDAKAKKLQKDSKPKNPLLSTPKVKSSKRGEAVQAKEGLAEKATSGPQLVKYYMSKAGGGMSREQAVAKMVRAKTGKIPSDDGKSMVKQPKMMYGGAMKKAMYGAKMKKKAMYGAKMKKKAMYGAKMNKKAMYGAKMKK